MNKTIQNAFLILLPFYPLWAWAYHFVTDKPLDLLVNVLLMPVAFSFLMKSKVRIPGYLICLIIFTFYHLASVLINKTIPSDTNSIYFILSDLNLFACTLFVIIENVKFNEKFITGMNRNILVIVILTLIVSAIQTKYPTFLFNEKLLEGDELEFWGDEIRNTAFYSWVGTNSLGITFPVFIAILLNFYDTQKKYFTLIILAGIVVSFLTKSRYVMVSTIIVFSQLFFATTKSWANKLSLVFLFAASIFLMTFIAGEVGFNIDEVISNRILEKDSEMGSAKARITSYEVFLVKFPENPLMGVGPKTRPDVVALLDGEAPLIHVGYLSYLYYYGIIGCFFIFLAIFYLLKNAWSVGKKYNFWGSFYGLVSFCFANITFVYFNFAETGIVIAIIYLRYYSSSGQMGFGGNENE
jgi:hypothetical protein